MLFEKYKTDTALHWEGQNYNYSSLVEEINLITKNLKDYCNLKGKVVALEADFSPKGIALLLSLINLEAIVVPLTKMEKKKRSIFKYCECPDTDIR